jgi:hypothetical protein
MSLLVGTRSESSTHRVLCGSPGPITKDAMMLFPQPAFFCFLSSLWHCLGTPFCTWVKYLTSLQCDTLPSSSWTQFTHHLLGEAFPNTLKPTLVFSLHIIMELQKVL